MENISNRKPAPQQLQAAPPGETGIPLSAVTPHPCAGCPHRAAWLGSTLKQPAQARGSSATGGWLIDPLATISIKEFCRRSTLARSTVNKLLKSQGLGLEPEIASVKAGRRRLISLIAAIRWLNGVA
jgi:hypothetical protein